MKITKSLKDTSDYYLETNENNSTLFMDKTEIN